MSEILIKHVVIDFDIEGYHQYPNAPTAVEFLKYPHRHIFQIRMGFEVEDSDREIEIFLMTDIVKTYISEEFGVPAEFGNMSCEHIAEKLLKKFNASWCEVFEDGKGGAKVEMLRY